MAAKEKIKEIVINILIVLSVLLAVIFIIWYMVGDSPTTEQILIAVVLPLYVFVFRSRERLNNKMNKSHHFLYGKISQTRETFQKDLGEIKKSLGRIEGKLNK